MNNRLVIDGELLNPEPLRFSPAGIPIAKATLKHASRQHGQVMQCELIIAAQGEMARQLNGLSAGCQIKVGGSITRASQNSRTLMMWIDELEPH